MNRSVTFDLALKGTFLNVVPEQPQLLIDFLPLIFGRYSKDSFYVVTLCEKYTLEDQSYVMELFSLMQQLDSHKLTSQTLASDLQKEISIREKSKGSYLIPSDGNLGLLFESMDCKQKVDVVLHELAQLLLLENTTSLSTKFGFMNSEVMACESFEDYILCILCHLIKNYPKQISLDFIVRGLLHLHDESDSVTSSLGLKYISRVVCNFPEQWENLCENLFSHIKQLLKDQQQLGSTFSASRINATALSMGTTAPLVFERYSELLKLLVQMNPTHTVHIIDYCINNRVLPELMLELSIDLDESGQSILLDVLMRIFFSSTDLTRIWLVKCLQKVTSNKHPLSRRFDLLLCHILDDLLECDDPSNPVLRYENVLTAQKFLYVLVALNIYAKRSLAIKVTKNILSLITRPVPVSITGNSLIISSLAFLVAFYSLLSKGSNGLEQIDLDTNIVRWLKHLLHRQYEFHQLFKALRQCSSKRVMGSVNSRSANFTAHSYLSHGPSVNKGLSNLDNVSLKSPPHNTKKPFSVLTNRSSSSYVELMLLIGILCQGGGSGSVGPGGSLSVSDQNYSLSNMASIVSQVFGLSIDASHIQMAHLQRIFLREVYRDKVITAQLANIPVTKCLNFYSTGCFPIQCVVTLLKNKTFVKNKIDIKDWIFSQMCACKSPIHPLTAELIDAFVNSLFVAMNSHSGNLVNKPIPEEHLRQLFCAKVCGAIASECALKEAVCDDDISGNNACNSTHKLLRRDYTPQILAMYYLLKFQEHLECKSLELNQKHRNIVTYSHEIWANIPFSFLLHFMSVKVADFSHGNLYSLVHKNIIQILPELLLSQYILKDQLALVSIWKDTEVTLPEEIDQNSIRFLYPVTPHQLDEAFQAVCLKRHTEESVRVEAHLLSLMKSLLNKVHSIKSIFLIVPHCAVLVKHLTLLLPMDSINGHAPPLIGRQIAEACFQMWCKLHLIMPRKLHLLTLHAFRRPSAETDRFLHGDRLPLVKEYEIYDDPIEKLLMYVEDRVYRSPHALAMLLRILDFALTASTKSRFTLAHNEFSSPPTPLLGSADDLPTPNVNDQQQANADRQHQSERLKRHYHIMLQSGVVQILIERCLPVGGEANASIKDEGISIRKECSLIICEYLHMLFLSDFSGELCALVHRQTYPRELLPLTVRGVPSLHIVHPSMWHTFQNCGKIDTMIFLLDLGSHLAEVYNIQTNLDTCRNMLEAVLAFSAVGLTSELRPAFFLACSDAIVRMTCAYPCLEPLACRYFTMATHQSMCELARLGVPIPAQFTIHWKKTPKVETNELLKSFRFLSLEEQYQQCFFKCKTALEEVAEKCGLQRLCYSSVD